MSDTFLESDRLLRDELREMRGEIVVGVLCLVCGTAISVTLDPCAEIHRAACVACGSSFQIKDIVKEETHAEDRTEDRVHPPD